MYLGCPNCRGYVEEAEYCDWCHEAWPVADMDYVNGGAFVCSRCREEEEEDEWEDG